MRHNVAFLGVERTILLRERKLTSEAAEQKAMDAVLTDDSEK